MKKSVKFLIAWIIQLMLVGLPTVCYAGYYAYLQGLTEPTVPRWYELTLLGIILFVGFPLLILSAYHAKKEKTKCIFWISVCLLLHNLLCVVGEVITWIK